ncbi:glycosyltransferase family 2 protein [Pseudonocardia acidicola]|uniref:Glycosyltransferase n=1 Tax=Pseudonocardia acidicola TaxID=2724939 RepID=A0ABX1SP25_9PSEU|nr:glycosyltransferase [Pseudonocardia acidicola]NMI02065.1 glycosyltransferase [Pseudonocardia acidicola]
MSQSGPTWVGELDRRAPIADLTVGSRYAAARLLVTAGGAPVGLVTVPLQAGRADARIIRAVVDAQLDPAHEPAVPPSSTEPVTVVIATRGRADSLARCVRSVLAGDHPAITVLVVDNDPDDECTADAVRALADPRVRYVREPRRGASVGRNRGLLEARTRIVVFTDDDTEVDPGWARRMAGAFAADPDLACVSGPVLAAQLATEEELAADTALAWNKGFATRRFSLADPPADSPIFPFSPGLFGIGANLAVRADIARAVGGFDEALGPGSATHGGEDCEFMVRLVLAGHVLGYEPSAYVWHHHRPDAGALRAQLRGYAVGLGGFLTKVALDRRARWAALRRLPAAVAQLRRISDRETGAGDGMPADAGRERLRGLMAGPWAYLRARRAARRAGGRVPPLTSRPDEPDDTDGRPNTRAAVAL